MASPPPPPRPPFRSPPSAGPAWRSWASSVSSGRAADRGDNRGDAPCRHVARVVSFPSMHVVIFEGVHWQTFAPLALSRPVFMLATGMSTLLDKQIRHTNPTRLTLWVRPELAELARQRIAPKLKVPTVVNEPLDDAPALLVSGRTLHFRKFDVPADPA